MRLEARQHRELKVRNRGLWGACGWAVGPGTASCGQALASHHTPHLDFSKAYCLLLPLYPCCVPFPIVCLTLLILTVNLYRQSTPSECVSENDTSPVTVLWGQEKSLKTTWRFMRDQGFLPSTPVHFHGPFAQWVAGGLCPIDKARLWEHDVTTYRSTLFDTFSSGEWVWLFQELVFQEGTQRLLSAEML